MSIEVAVALFAAVVAGVAVGLLRRKREPENPQKAAPRDPWRQFYEDVVPHINGATRRKGGGELWVTEDMKAYVGAELYCIEHFEAVEGRWFISGVRSISETEEERITLRGRC